MRVITVFLVLSYAGCSDDVVELDSSVMDSGTDASTFDGSVSVEVACANGQTSPPPVLPPPETIEAYWEELRANTPGVVAVVARRSAASMSRAPILSPNTFSDGRRLAFCMEGAEHEVVDGLGWVSDAIVSVEARTTKTFWASGDGTPLLECDQFVPGDGFDAEFNTVAADDVGYLLFLAPSARGGHSLLRRAALVDGMVSGAGTTEGTTSSLDLYMAP